MYLTVAVRHSVTVEVFFLVVSRYRLLKMLSFVQQMRDNDHSHHLQQQWPPTHTTARISNIAETVSKFYNNLLLKFSLWTAYCPVHPPPPPYVQGSPGDRKNWKRAFLALNKWLRHHIRNLEYTGFGDIERMTGLSRDVCSSVSCHIKPSPASPENIKMGYYLNKHST